MSNIGRATVNRTRVRTGPTITQTMVATREALRQALEQRARKLEQDRIAQYTALAQSQAAVANAVAALSEQLAIQFVIVPSGQTPPTAQQLAIQAQTELAQVQQAIVEARSVGEVSAFLQQYQTEQQQRLAKRRRDLADVRAAEDAFATQTPSPNPQAYALAQARRAEQDAAILLAQYQTGASADAALRDALAPALEAAQHAFQAASARIDTDPANARLAIEAARGALAQAAGAAGEQARQDRATLQTVLRLTDARLATLVQFADVLRQDGAPLSDVDPKLAELTGSVQRMGVALLDLQQAPRPLIQHAKALEQEVANLSDLLQERASAHQRGKTAQDIEEVLKELGYGPAVKGQPIAHQVGNVWRLDGTRNGRQGNTEAIHIRVRPQPSGFGLSWETRGFIGTDCETAKDKFLDKLRERGIVLDDMWEHHFGGHRFEKTLLRIEQVLHGLGFQQVVRHDNAGHVTLEAFSGTTGYTVTMESDGRESVLFMTPQGEVTASSVAELDESFRKLHRQQAPHVPQEPSIEELIEQQAAEQRQLEEEILGLSQ